MPSYQLAFDPDAGLPAPGDEVTVTVRVNAPLTEIAVMTTGRLEH